MTTITATIIADSISRENVRLTTMQLRYPRWIHAEGRTHRKLSLEEELELPTPSLMADPNLSRNASSSRAIPVDKLIADVLKDPAIPMYWGANQRGMQSGAEHDDTVMIGLINHPKEAAWLIARDRAIEVARAFAEAGYHKQIVNRLLEPFSHINVVVTATEWSNFFALRAHSDAEPHIQLLARRMATAMSRSTPRLLQPGEWHLPYVSDTEFVEAGEMNSRGLSVARCARVSYLTHEGKPPSLADDLKLASRLVSTVPLHASPAEHQATPDFQVSMPNYTGWSFPEQHGNLRGWRQYRKMLPGECQ